LARLVLTVFGGFEARVNPPGRPLHVPLKKGRAILAMLAWAPGGARTRETLIGPLAVDMISPTDGWHDRWRDHEAERRRRSPWAGAGSHAAV